MSKAVRWTLVVVVIGIVAALALWGFQGAGSAVAFTTVERGEFLVDIETTGEVHAVNSRAITRPPGGWSPTQIVTMAPEGSVVEEGEFLIQFDTSEWERRVAEKKNELLNAEAELESQRANAVSRMAELKSALQRQELSYEQSRIRFEQMEYEADIRRREQELELKKAELTLQEARERIGSQEVIQAAERSKALLKVEQATRELEQAEKTLSEQTVNAPEGGLVVYKEIWRSGGRSKVKVGDQPWPGQELIELPDLSAMMVRTKVNEVDINRIAEEQEVLIEVDALPDQDFTGKISRVATLAKREGDSEVKYFDVDVLIEGQGEDLRPGMSASCRIVTERLADVCSIPLECVFEEDGETIVYMGDAGHSARKVKLGPKNADFVVVEEGLEAGDRVCLRDPQAPLEDVGGDENGSEPAER